MRRMDELHLNYPFAGSRMLRDMLRLERRLHHSTQPGANTRRTQRQQTHHRSPDDPAVVPVLNWLDLYRSSTYGI